MLPPIHMTIALNVMQTRSSLPPSRPRDQLSQPVHVQGTGSGSVPTMNPGLRLCPMKFRMSLFLVSIASVLRIYE